MGNNNSQSIVTPSPNHDIQISDQINPPPIHLARSSYNQNQSKISSNLKSPSIAHKYNAFQTKQGNVVWAGATNLAFNQLKSKFLNEKNLQFKNTTPKARSTLIKLNNPKFTKKQIKSNAVYIKSGLGNQTIRLINKQMKLKFPFKTTESLQEQSKDNDFISYAYLFKALAYEHNFQRIAGILWFGKAIPGQVQRDPYMVQAFSALTKQCRDQIKVIEYNGSQDYFIGFKAKQVCEKSGIKIDSKEQNEQNESLWSKIINFIFSLFSSGQIEQAFSNKLNQDVIYILCSSSNQTVDTVVEKVLKAQRQKSIDQRPSNERLVQFIMPVIDMDIKRQYLQFKGLQINNSQLEGMKLKIVEQIKLRMDQKGVIVQNQAFICKDQCAIMGNIQININKPFWLILTEEGNHPYLVVKINYLPQKVLNRGQQFY